MHIEFITSARNQLIDLGNRIGHALRGNDRPRPWVIGLDGDEMSGKSLIAFGIDEALRPSEYPDGIPKNLSVDFQMRQRSNVPAVFFNFGRSRHLMRPAFDAQLDIFASHNPQARVLIASNLFRTLRGDFNYRAQGLDSDRLDCNFQIHVAGPGFTRHVGVTVDDAVLKMAIIEKPLKPAAP